MAECLIRSINKFTPKSLIYVFDNSDKEPFTYIQDNITYYDNTKGQYINFDEWLKKYPERTKSKGSFNNYGSAKHSVSIQKCIELINDNFILLDSDILLRRDISPIANNKYVFVGQSGTETSKRWPLHRVFPWFCYLNVKMMKEKKISFFDEKRMYGLYYNKKSELYDTGTSFLEDIKNLPKLEITNLKYILHYKGGSYSNNNGKRISAKQWLSQYKRYWVPTMKNKKVIYTCITGNYDYLLAQPTIEGYDYVCFTDSPQSSTTWTVKAIPENIKHLSKVKQQRWVKLHPHKLLPDYDYSIWIDANVKVLGNPNELIDEAYSVEIPKHPVRNCIYAEKRACLMIKKDKEEIMEPQMERYRAEGYPKNNGLVQTNIMFRKHNDAGCIKLMEDWWAEIEKGSHRDQLSFNYALWKNKDVTFKYLHEKTCDSKIFKWYKSHGLILKHKATLDKPVAVIPIVNGTPKESAIAVKSKFKWVKKNNNKNDELKTFLSQY